MEQYIQSYEGIIDKIIKIHKNSLKEIIISIKNLNIYDDDFLLRLVSYLKLCKLYEITNEFFRDFKYYILSLGDSYFIFYDGKHCSCDLEINKKIQYKNICIHLLVFKIFLGINNYTKMEIDKNKMKELINEINSNSIKI